MQPIFVLLGEVPFNHEILREAYALCHCLPVLSTDKFKTDFYDVSLKPRMGRRGLCCHFCMQEWDSAIPWACCKVPRTLGELSLSVPSQQCNDVGLMAYLGTITKTCNTMNQFVNKFNVLYDRQGIGRRMRGLFF